MNLPRTSAIAWLAARCANPVASGGQCSKSEQCQHGLDCYSPGVCQASAEIGGSCVNTGCVADAVCVNNQCVAQTAVGAACDANNDNCNINLGLSCDPTTLKCVQGATAAINANCTNGQTCENSGVCSSTTGVCQAAPADGASCDSSNPCRYPAQCINQVCVFPDATKCQ